MKPHTIINQTLHSYCKEQYEFNTQPMFINLTEYWYFSLKTSRFFVLLIDGLPDLFIHIIHIKNSVEKLSKK